MLQTVSVKNKAGLQKVPPVSGLLTYRKDNEELYVNNGSQWNALSNEKEVSIFLFRTFSDW